MKPPQNAWKWTNTPVSQHKFGHVIAQLTQVYLITFMIISISFDAGRVLLLSSFWPCFSLCCCFAAVSLSLHSSQPKTGCKISIKHISHEAVPQHFRLVWENGILRRTNKNPRSPQIHYDIIAMEFHRLHCPLLVKSWTAWCYKCSNISSVFLFFYTRYMTFYRRQFF